MQAYGAECVPSPSEETESGRKILAKDPDTTGSLGIAISEAVELAAKSDDTKYSLGSVLNHVMTHQSVIGLEAIKQMEMADAYPDVIFGAAGGSWASSRRAPSTRPAASRPACSSRAPRASFRRPRATTRSKAPSTRRSRSCRRFDRAFGD